MFIDKLNCREKLMTGFTLKLDFENCGINEEVELYSKDKWLSLIFQQRIAFN